MNVITDLEKKELSSFLLPSGSALSRIIPKALDVLQILNKSKKECIEVKKKIFDMNKEFFDVYGILRANEFFDLADSITVATIQSKFDISSIEKYIDKNAFRPVIIEAYNKYFEDKIKELDLKISLKYIANDSSLSRERILRHCLLTPIRLKDNEFDKINKLKDMTLNYPELWEGDVKFVTRFLIRIDYSDEIVKL